ncbi:glycosyltransferase family 4 protein [Methylovirgula sp. 4M-Z18]|uniref:glycosyltransferase family 4 protein n=1 Tax=Methylovirgula sp. 4M-Z18 TaxID=2293567 RepID=UPI000E2F9027|nr:glycosyltransferase family 4 protein [Methylovirgula sp. 4M-Z18]RFB81078.1 glycosyltransferase family 1 protein [Methylovirgula sp. 4M-Z18]
MRKLLLIAPTCDGQDVGEAWVAYQWVKRLAVRNDVTLLTYNKRSKLPASVQLPGLRVVEWTEPSLFSRVERFNSLLKPGYIPFYIKARGWIRRALAQGEKFDLAHQILPVAMRYPSPLAGLGLRYLIGPVGGSLDSPEGFKGDRDTAPWYVGLRRLDRLRMRFDPWLRQTYTDASCVVGIAPYVRSFLSGLPVRRFEILSETGLEALPDAVDRSGRVGPLRLLYVGRVIRTKGIRDAIRAMALLKDLPLVLDVVGDGFDRAICEDLVAKLGLAERVIFHGRLARADVDRFYQSADIFVFPSYREPGGNAVFEAMGWGLPIVTCDRGGPGAAVDETSGILITPVDPNQFAHAISDAIRHLAMNRALRLMLGDGARLRAATVALWTQKVRRMEELYLKLSDEATLSDVEAQSNNCDLGLNERQRLQ